MEGSNKGRRRYSSKAAAGNIVSGEWVKSHSILVDMFGCAKCPWIDTNLCPHLGEVTKVRTESQGPRFHANKICSSRAKWVSELFSTVRDNPQLAQVDHAMKLGFILDEMQTKYIQTGVVPEGFANISKNYIAVLDKNRKANLNEKAVTQGIGLLPDADKLREMIEVGYNRIHGIEESKIKDAEFNSPQEKEDEDEA